MYRVDTDEGQAILKLHRTEREVCCVSNLQASDLTHVQDTHLLYLDSAHLETVA